MTEPESIPNEGHSVPVVPLADSGATAPETTVIGMPPEAFQGGAVEGKAAPREVSVHVGPPADAADSSSVSPVFDVSPSINNRYQLKRLLGRGGYATVYEAWDETLRRSVAIKVPRRERFVSRTQLDEFLTEAQTAARLKHRMIVTVHDVGWTPEGACFIVLDYIEGGTLTQAMSRRRFTPEQAARLMADVAEAVSYANQQGLIHRDLKPSNILLDAAGQPFVSDFGLAAVAQSPELRNSEVVGTPPFMAPEQVRGENHRLDGRTDLWGLGVIFYVLLVGRLPFRKEGGDYFQEILYHDPRPPRQIDSHVPKELDRICLRCLAKRMTERYASVADFGEELRSWLDRRRLGDSPPVNPAELAVFSDAGSSGQRPRTERSGPRPKVVPKGLRSYGSRDSEFFLQLLPGPRDAEGLPESLRFWRQVFEGTAADNTAAVGLLYGPSGCGKSSFLKAGLIPRLAPHVVPLYVEATPDDFETRLLKRLRSEFPGLPPDAGLAETWLTLRDGKILPPDRKVVVVIDQFEQWLNAHRHEGETDLLRALRHCDGARVQCLLAVRDDFGMAATRFMGDLEIPIVQGHNFATIDRFSPAHAKRVLADFGKAFGQLSESEEEWSAPQERFLEQAVDSLMEDGKVIPVRLALFAEMVKDRPWTLQTLANLGGAEGVGVAFLEETFASRSANPAHLIHQDAVRRILGSLLPEQGTDIRGSRVGAQQLQNASGYGADPRSFEAALRILDSDLRLITPVEDPDALQGSESSRMASASGRHEKFYQLTHDYLVPSIRSWLTRAQRETRRGRIELQLAEQAALWNVKPVRGLLPSAWTWLNALLLTHHWSDAQRRMMRAATRYYAALGATAALLLLALTLGTVWARRQMAADDNEKHAEQLVHRLMSAEFSKTPAIISEMQSDLYRPLVLPLLRKEAAHARSEKEELHASLALLSDEPARLPRLIEMAMTLDPDRLELLAEDLAPHAAAVRDACWKVAEASGEQAPGEQAGRRLRAACLLARVDPENARWASLAGPVAAEFVVGQSKLLAPKWTKLLHPARRWLVPPLRELFLSDRNQVLTAAVLAQYCDEAAQWAELIQTASHEQFRELLQSLQSPQSPPPYAAELVQLLEAALQERPPVEWPDEPSAFPRAPGPQTLAAIERALGLVADRWAFCQALPFAEFEKVAADLTLAGYRPGSLRPYLLGKSPLMAATWVRDGRKWTWEHERPASELVDLDGQHRAQGLVPFDVAAMRPNSDGATPVLFSVLWVERPAELIDSKMYVGVTQADHQAHWDPLNNNGFVPRTNLLVNAGSETLWSSVRWRFSRNFEYEDCWHEPSSSAKFDERGDWVQPDVRDTFSGGGAPGQSTVWWDRGGFSSKSVRELPAAIHLEKLREFASLGYRPVSISVVASVDGKGVVGSSTWHRPVPSEEVRAAHARRQAGAALALLRMSREELVWAPLRSSPDPTLRSLLIHGFARTGVDPRRLWNRLSNEPEASVRQALLLGLSRYPPTSAAVTDDDRERLRRLYGEDEDPGVHSAAFTLLRTLTPDESPTSHRSSPTAGGRRWSETSQVKGHVMAHIRGPVEFQMGSSPNEAYHESGLERQHLVRIPRSYAISTMEVTVEQFLRFRENANYAHDYTPERSCPMTMITYNDALRYCRWLSDQEGLPESEMCYPPLNEIVNNNGDEQDVVVREDCLERTGYRLPTEMEWEFAARAGTTTARPFGAAEELLPEYAWTVQTSGYRAHPVARLLPNDYGLFDILGNAMEFCQNVRKTHGRDPSGQARVDELDPKAFRTIERRERRGGAFLYQPADARPAHHDWGSIPFPFSGFRIARTLRP